jgi:4a-hydroxytetrahydrobiopterin dehydratase
MNLAHKKCAPCSEGGKPLKGKELQHLFKQLKEGWNVIDEHHLEKSYAFPDFAHALAFTNVVGEIAEKEGHHPDVYLSWGKVQLKIWTHKMDGLSESDLILAAKCDEAFNDYQVKTACF